MADKKLGILVTTNKYPDEIIRIVNEASGSKAEVMLFMMDEGVLLCRNNAFTKAIVENNVNISICDYNARLLGMDTEKEVAKEIVCGSQYNNAIMNHDSDRVLVF